MKRFLAATVLFGTLGTVFTFAKEAKIKLEDCPAAVQQAIKDNTKNVTLLGIAKDVENGKVEYEAETKLNGHSKDITFDETGKLLAVEEEVSISDIPAAAKTAIEKQATGGKIRKVEKITDGEKVTYEAALTKNGKKSEVTVAGDGSPATED